MKTPDHIVLVPPAGFKLEGVDARSKRLSATQRANMRTYIWMSQHRVTADTPSWTSKEKEQIARQCCVTVRNELALLCNIAVHRKFIIYMRS